MALRIIRQGNDEFTSDHNQLVNRDMANQHPIEAIVGLKFILDGLLERSQIDVVRTYDEMMGIQNPTEQNFALVKEEEILYRFKEETGQWVQVSSTQSSGVSAPIYQVFESTENQKTFVLQNPYIPGSNTLDVYVEGLLVKSDRADSIGNNTSEYDYLEVDRYTIEFISPLNAGVTVVVKQDTFNTYIDTETETIWEPMVTYPTWKRVKTEIVRGDIEYVRNFYYDEWDMVIQEEVIENGVYRYIDYIYDDDGYVINTITTGGETVTVHKLLPDGRKIFEFLNQTQIICEHNADTIYVHISVYSNNIEISNQVTREILDNNTVRISSATPITGYVVVN